MAPARKIRSWAGLGENQQKRLEGAGRSGRLTGTPGLTASQVKSYYESGGDLNSGYGRKGAEPPRSRYQPPEAAARAIVQGLATPDEERQLRKWLRSDAPPWLPRNPDSMGIDVIAALAEIRRPPTDWKSTAMVYHYTGEHAGRWVMTVTYKNGRPKTESTVLPEGQGVARSVGQWLQDPASVSTTQADKRRMRKAWKNAHPEVRFVNSDPKI
jgi:hypothetical protein